MKNRAGVIIVCTNKYDVFLQPLIDSLEKFFFKGEHYDIYLFTDKPQPSLQSSRGIIYIRVIPSYGFPLATLYRYKMMTENNDVFNSENVYYLDVDMLLVGEVGEEIIGDGLVAVRHPGYYNGGWGDMGTKPLSKAYINPDERGNYYCGGFQGGKRGAYLKAAKKMSEDIEKDLELARSIGYTDNGGVLARYHDESHWNRYLSEHDYKELTPVYCMVEQVHLRKEWGIYHFNPKIIALEKDHKKLRT